MRASTPELDSILVGSFKHRWLADLHYDGRRVLADIPITGMQLKEDVSGAIEASGSCTLVWTDDFGQSMSPEQVGDVFAPFGAELAVYCIPSAGAAEARVQMGWFPIFDVPSARDETQLFRGRTITTGSVVELVFKDRFLGVQRDRFDVPGVPRSLTSVYAELARLTGLQITRTVPDAPITRSVVYEEDRLKAIYDLAGVLDCTPSMTPDGTLTLRPKTAGGSAATLRIGEEGTILSVGRALSSEQVYNRVAFRGKTDDKDVILAVAQRTSGRLRVRNVDGSRSPFGTVSKFLASEFVTTSAQARVYVDKELERAARLGTTKVTVETTFNPLYELGDVLTLKRPDGRTVEGRITSISRSMSGLMPIELEVPGG